MQISPNTTTTTETTTTTTKIIIMIIIIIDLIILKKIKTYFIFCHIMFLQNKATEISFIDITI